MDRSQYPGRLAFARLVRASDPEPGGVSNRPENNVLGFLAEIAYRLIPQELTQNAKYPHNPCDYSYL
jgi:hypothetical protein